MGEYQKTKRALVEAIVLFIIFILLLTALGAKPPKPGQLPLSVTIYESTNLVDWVEIDQVVLVVDEKSTAFYKAVLEFNEGL